MEELKTDDIIIQPILKPEYTEKKVSVSVLRLDRVHPIISGNKWFKLKFYFDDAKRLDKKKIITFGGAWSNHIVATACAASMNHFQSTGIIRGEEPVIYSDTLKKAREYGMDFCFLSRDNYRKKIVPSTILTEDAYIIPEGGYEGKGAAGFATALDYCDKNSFSHFICAVGTGTMMAGVIKSISASQKTIGIPVLKNNNDLLPAVEQLLSREERLRYYELVEDYHFGGYAKITSLLIDFMNSFYQECNIPTDFVYTGKLFYAVDNLIQKNYFPAGSNILVIHSGGLQGNNSLSPGTLIF